MPTSDERESWEQAKQRLRERYGDLGRGLDGLRDKPDHIVGHIHEMTGRDRVEIQREIDAMSRTWAW